MPASGGFCSARRALGHVLYLKSELTENRWRIWSDNIQMARWLQSTVQGMLNAELKDTTIPVFEAEFSRSGDARDFWTERLISLDDEISLTWHQLGEPLLIHTQPNQIPDRRYGVCTILIPALGRPPVAQRHPGQGPTLAARAREPPVQHQRARFFRKLD